MQLTTNQQRVFTTLQQAKEPLSAYALLKLLRKPGFNAPTQVYRALDRLVQHGLVHRLETLNAYVTCSHQDCKKSVIAFAICDTCGHIDEFSDKDLSRSLGRWAKNHTFALGSTAIEIRGQCAVCTSLSEAEN